MITNLLIKYPNIYVTALVLRLELVQICDLIAQLIEPR